MKKGIFLIGLILNFCFSHAQKFHLVMVGDTQDERIGESCDRDIDRISSEANTICRSIGYQLNRLIIKDENFTPTNIKEALATLNCGKEDIIYFHYSGHGKRSIDNETHWPDLDFKDRGTLPLLEIKKWIGTKPARLKIVIADCCNQFSSGTDRPTFEPIPSLMTTNIEGNRKKLFTESSCFVISSGSQPGQFSYGTYEEGGYFTNAFLEALQYNILTTNQADWNSVFADAQLRTKRKAMKNHKKQFPQFQILENQENKPKPEPQATESPSKQEKQADLAQINEYLNELVSTDITDKEKEKSIKNFTKYFHQKARVDVYKNTTLVDREQIEDFLNRIYLESKQIEHINLIEQACKLREGKYEVITVQEIRD
jgi:hypothetical protein